VTPLLRNCNHDYVGVRISFCPSSSSLSPDSAIEPLASLLRINELIVVMGLETLKQHGYSRLYGEGDGFESRSGRKFL
jgi:hypothetical protein